MPVARAQLEIWCRFACIARAHADLLHASIGRTRRRSVRRHRDEIKEVMRLSKRL